MPRHTTPQTNTACTPHQAAFLPLIFDQYLRSWLTKLMSRYRCRSLPMLLSAPLSPYMLVQAFNALLALRQLISCWPRATCRARRASRAVSSSTQANVRVPKTTSGAFVCSWYTTGPSAHVTVLPSLRSMLPSTFIWLKYLWHISRPSTKQQQNGMGAVGSSVSTHTALQTMFA